MLQTWNLKSYVTLIGWALKRRRNVSPVKYEIGFFFIPHGGILRRHRPENLKSYILSLTAIEPRTPNP
jgi:hypothetical protein